MGIYIIKIYKRIKSVFKIIIWKLLYGRKFKCCFFNVFYPETHITIDKGQLTIGKKCFFNHGCSINCMYKIIIGDDCIFGENVKIYDHNHNYKNNTLIREQGFSTNEVIIGNNCWIGSNVTILKNVHIGNNVGIYPIERSGR